MQMSHLSWNVGGAATGRIIDAVREVEHSQGQGIDVFTIQELPREPQGWHFEEVQGWHIHSYRAESTWRGTGLAFKAAHWTLMRKRSSDKGIWCRLRRNRDGLQVWCGTFHFTQGATREIHAKDTHSFLESVPVCGLPIIVGGDTNTELKWEAPDDDRAYAFSGESKGEYMLGAFMEKGIEFTPPMPCQWSTPTSRPRNQEATGRQIDGVASKRVRSATTSILEESYMTVCSDHDAVLHRVEIAHRAIQGCRRPPTAPRKVAKPVHIPERLDQQSLHIMAKQFTVPYKGCSYKDPADVKVLFQMARSGRQPQDWKKALRARSDARRAWATEQIARAANGDWGAYRETQRKGATGWEAHFADAQPEGVEPHACIHDHLQGIYEHKPMNPFPFDEVQRSEDFTVEELRDALGKGKLQKAVGEDQVSHELLKAIGEDDRGAQLLVAWFNRMLHGEEAIPDDWGRVIMILIPKMARPVVPKDLRPICLGSATSKLYSRMLLARSMDALAYSTPSQVMGEGRQAADYLWSMGRIMQLEQEWKQGLWAIKLDVAKAFDTLDRNMLLARLATKLGGTEVLRSWWDLFSQTDATLTTSWGSSTVHMSSGIRQGAVESPHLFSAAVDWIIGDAIQGEAWCRFQDSYVGLGVSEAAYVDDLLMWHGSREGLQHRVRTLSEELRKEKNSDELEQVPAICQSVLQGQRGLCGG